MHKIHFKFTLTFVEAQYLSNMFTRDMCKIHKDSRKSAMAGNQAEVDWYDRHLVYVEELIEKMTYTVDDENELIIFDYIVDGIDSQNIYDIVRQEKLDRFMDIMDEMVGENRPARIEWFKKRQKYSDDFIEKMYAEVESFEDEEGE